MSRPASRTAAGAVATAAALAAMLCACSGDAGSGSASRRARQFYSALNTQDFDRAGSMLEGESGTARLLERFGSMQDWGDRVTKNGIVAQLHATEKSADRDAASVELLVMFNDGTRRRDELRLLRRDDAWQVDADSVPGNEVNSEP